MLKTITRESGALDIRIVLIDDHEIFLAGFGPTVLPVTIATTWKGPVGCAAKNREQRAAY